jgi:hypothetical protein
VEHDEDGDVTDAAEIGVLFDLILDETLVDQHEKQILDHGCEKFKLKVKVKVGKRGETYFFKAESLQKKLSTTRTRLLGGFNKNAKISLSRKLKDEKFPIFYASNNFYIIVYKFQIIVHE